MIEVREPGKRYGDRTAMDGPSYQVGSIGGWPSLGLVCGYSAVLLALAAVMLRRRDA
ncbi:hypothetical protein SAMN04489712_10989 [Thermomonospora echinospora]|uniref:Uncharacterized protein n=1 Tax=Thermomonospora echinospora TaxID=1992 RepID=A0A1H6CA42_9ACTN|nr:hypothetical protein [Thermomonospora echinospora]SEG69495.1 hypothetical protein SAMN04489712_10989 [Thermomonospora echinospora]